MKAVRVLVHGRVQGVGFREWTRRMAEQRSLTGWVRNRSEGTVEAVIAGDALMVEAMLVLLAKGPPASFVTKLHSEPADPPEGSSFIRLPTV